MDANYMEKWRHVSEKLILTSFIHLISIIYIRKQEVSVNFTLRDALFKVSEPI